MVDRSAPRLRGRRALSWPLSVLIVLPALAGCTDGTRLPVIGSDRQAESPTVVTVTRGDIISVITLPAQVRAAPPAVLTSPEAGTVESVTGDAIVLVNDEGENVTLRVPAGTRLVAPLVERGDRIPANFPVAQLRLTGFGVVAEIDQTTIYRLYEPPLGARAEISQGPGPFDCPLVSRVPGFNDLAVGPSSEPEAEALPTGPVGPLTVVCVVPADLTVFEGMPAVLALTTADVRDVLTLPVEAVAGTAERGLVLLEGPDGPVEREVVLGPTDGIRIQIVSGVDDDDRVRVPGPDLDGTR